MFSRDSGQRAHSAALEAAMRVAQREEGVTDASFALLDEKITAEDLKKSKKSQEAQWMRQGTLSSHGLIDAARAMLGQI
jgi:hypothetical protein